MLSTAWIPQRVSWSYIEKKRGRREIEVTRWRRGGVKRGENSLASNEFPICSPQSGTLKRGSQSSMEKREEGDSGDQEERRGLEVTRMR